MQVELRQPRPLDVRRTFHWLLQKPLRDDFMMANAPQIRTHIRYWRAVLELQSKDQFFSIYADNTHVGNCGIKNIRENCTGEAWIYLGDPYVRGQGIGKRAMGCLIQEALSMRLAELTLHVSVDNEAAKRLYRREGFVSVESGPASSFGFQVDAEICLMRKSL